MKKTIIINNLEDVLEGDILFVAGRSDGFRVACTRTDSPSCPIVVDNPFDDGIAYVRENRFDHAERTIDEHEWPHPEDLKLHVYIGADGANYLYMPENELDEFPWIRFPSPQDLVLWMSGDDLATYCTNALPLTEVNLVPKEEEA